MKIYNYHPITKEFLDESSADIDPLESEKQKKEVYLVPSNSTRIQPPNVSENQVVCFINDNWVIKSDFRGQTYYDKLTKDAYIIDFIGDIPDNLQKTQPEKTLSELKADLETIISYKFQEKISQGQKTSIQSISEKETQLENIIMDYASEDLSLFSASVQKIEKIEAGLSTYEIEFPDLKDSQGNVIFKFHNYDSDTNKHYLFVQSHDNKKFYILPEEMKIIAEETTTAYQKVWGMKMYFESLKDTAQTVEEMQAINVNYSII